MKNLNEFDVEIYKLNDSVHQFDFPISDEFFGFFENSPVEKGDLLAKIELDKSPTLISTNFSIEGQVELVCDRSLESFMHDLKIERKLIFKFGHDNEELSDEIYTIRRDTLVLNIAQFIYEFIGLEIPIKKLHPRFKDEEIEGEGIVIYSTGEEEAEKEKDGADPRWEALKKLKDKQ